MHCTSSINRGSSWHNTRNFMLNWLWLLFNINREHIFIVIDRKKKSAPTILPKRYLNFKKILIKRFKRYSSLLNSEYTDLKIVGKNSQVSLDAISKRNSELVKAVFFHFIPIVLWIGFSRSLSWKLPFIFKLNFNFKSKYLH